MLPPRDPALAYMRTPVRCKWCNNEFPNRFALYAHLRFCSHRAVYRFFKCGKYLFILSLNPLSRIMDTINRLINETHDAKILTGYLKGLQLNRELHIFTAFILTQRESILLKDGHWFKPRLEKKLHYDDYRVLLSTLVDIKEASK